MLSDDCGGHFNTVFNTVLCSMSQPPTIFYLCHWVLSCSEVTKGWLYSRHKLRHSVNYDTYVGYGILILTIFYYYQAEKNRFIIILNHQQHPEMWKARQDRDSYMYAVYAKFWAYYQQKSRLISWGNFFNCEPLWIAGSCSYLTRAVPNVAFCCCSQSASWFDVLYV